MLRVCIWVVAPALLLGQTQPWKDKPVPAWTEDDARIVMAESPWVKSVTPDVGTAKTSSTARRAGSVLGQLGGVRMGGMGRPYPGRGGSPGQGPQQGRQPQRPSVLTVRWESALPMREAELKARDTAAPTVDDGYYVVAVYGLPREVVQTGMEKRLQKAGVLRRDGKKDLQAARVRVLAREDGPVVVYMFSRTAGLSGDDRRIEFSGEAGKWKFAAPFFTEDMRLGGKVEL